VLHSDGKEATAADFLPEVKAGLVPVLFNVGQVVADDRPEYGAHGRTVAVFNQPAGIGNECSCPMEGSAMRASWGLERLPQRWAVSLWTTPGTCECSFVCVKFWLCKSPR